MTCGNLDFGRKALDLVSCGCSSNGYSERFSLRRHRSSKAGSCRGFVGRKLHCFRRDSAPCRVLPMKTSETLFNGNALEAIASCQTLCFTDLVNDQLECRIWHAQYMFDDRAALAICASVYIWFAIEGFQLQTSARALTYYIKIVKLQIAVSIYWV